MSEVSDNEIFSGLANPTRLQILDKLQKEPRRIAALAKGIGITIQAIQRHVDRLLASGLIIRDNEGNLSISAVGTASLAQIPTLLFIAENKNSFQNISFSGIPKRLLKRIGELAKSESLDNPMLSWQKGRDLVRNAEKFIYGISAAHPIEFYDVARPQIKKGVKFQLVFPQKMTVARGFEQKRKKTGWLECLKSGQAQEKFVKETPIRLGISDKEALVAFAGKKTDSHLFFSKEKEFRNWCLELFYHYWNDVEKVSTHKVQEV